MGYTEKVLVVGAGISGLACAYRLKQLGIHCTVLESTERAGGLIATVRRDWFLFESGPQFPRFPEAVWRLVGDLNLKGEFLGGEPKAKRYILRDGQLHAAPFSPGGLMGTRLFGFGSKLRLASEFLRRSHPPDHEETLAEFVERKFGAEVADNLVDPIVSTVFLGDARKMGMESAFPALVNWERNDGSLVRGAIRARNAKRESINAESSAKDLQPEKNAKSLRVTDALPALGTFKNGMARLPERLAEELSDEIRYTAEVTSVERVQDGGPSAANWQIGLADGERLPARCVILAVPAYTACWLLKNSASELTLRLSAIEYAPMCVVASAYRRSQVANPLDGFGFMVPRREGLHTICTFWNSSLFPERAPNGKVVLTSFARPNVGGDGHGLTEEVCARTVEAENARILGINGAPVDRMVWASPSAMPQYNLGHARRIVEIESILQTVPGLRLIGNYLKGRSIGDCVELAFRVADELQGRLRKSDAQTMERA